MGDERDGQGFRADELKAKTRFARAMLRFGDPLKAAKVVQPYDAFKAVVLGREWEHDPEVIGIMEDLREAEGDEAFLPTKADLARQAWGIVQGHFFAEDRLKAMSLYADVLGYKAPKVLPPTAPTSVTNNVLILEAPTDSFEEDIRFRQARLVNASDT